MFDFFVLYPPAVGLSDLYCKIKYFIRNFCVAPCIFNKYLHRERYLKSFFFHRDGLRVSPLLFSVTWGWARIQGGFISTGI